MCTLTQRARERGRESEREGERERDKGEGWGWEAGGKDETLTEGEQNKESGFVTGLGERKTRRKRAR